MKKRIFSIIAIAVLVVILATCFISCTDKDADALAVCLASEPASLDPALNSAVDGATMLIHLFAGLTKYNKDGVIVADAAEALPTASIADNGEATYVFKLREGMKWSNGDDVLASDFEWAWKRAASEELGADYGYMFEVVKGYEDGNLAVTADDAARTLTVTLTVDVPYFYELCAFPAYFPLYNRDKHVIDNDGKWATKPKTYICNGPYTIKSWKHNQYITIEKNPNYYDADSITMPKIRFYLSDNESTMLTNYKTSSWLFIDDVPQDEIASLKQSNPDELFVGSQLGTYYISFNINNNLLPATYSAGKTATQLAQANRMVRWALSLLLDRNYICEEIGQAGQVPASSFVALGLTDPSDPNGKQFYENAGWDGYDIVTYDHDYIGYFDATSAGNDANKARALTALKAIYTWDDATNKFTDFPAFTYLYNTNEGHKQIAEYIQGALGAYGITMNLENQEWATFLSTRKDGNYGVARNGWLGDYNDPISFLDMWTTASGNNDVQFGKYEDEAMTLETKYDASEVAIYSINLASYGGRYTDAKYNVSNGTWAQTYDVLISAIKTETNTVTRYKLMHDAEDLLMETGCICPLYYYTDLYMCSTKLTGFFASPLGYKYFMYTTLAA